MMHEHVHSGVDAACLLVFVVLGGQWFAPMVDMDTCSGCVHNGGIRPQFLWCACGFEVGREDRCHAGDEVAIMVVVGLDEVRGTFIGLELSIRAWDC